MGRAFNWEVGVLYLAIDPSTTVSGFAYSSALDSLERVRGVFSVSDITDAQRAKEFLEQIAEKVLYKRIVLTVEYPTWNAGASPTVRAAANTWIRFVKALFPRIVEVRKVSPDVWQRSFDYRRRPRKYPTTKDYSLFLAASYQWSVLNSDEADAAMICEFARLIPPTPKISKKIKKT